MAYYFISLQKKMQAKATYGISVVLALVLFFLANYLNKTSPWFVNVGLVGAVVPWEALFQNPDASYANVSALVPFLFAMKVPPSIVVNNLMIVVLAFVVLFLASEFMTLFDFGTQVKRRIHVSYGKAQSSPVTYANGKTNTVLKCVHSSQCPSGTTCQLQQKNSLSAAQCKGWQNVYVPALCSVSKTKCNAASDCPTGESCLPEACYTRFCDKDKNCWGECRKA